MVPERKQQHHHQFQVIATASRLRLPTRSRRVSIKKSPQPWYILASLRRVDKNHPLLSVASMLGPSPDWVVGVSKLNLCRKDCTWTKSEIIDLYPWDAGTDNGISYMSPNSETKPREKMKPITTLYPEDPRSPFYDPTGRPMLPLARLYLNREKIISRSCDDNTLQQQVTQLEVAENTEDTSRRAIHPLLVSSRGKVSRLTFSRCLQPSVRRPSTRPGLAAR